jgi:hypothetical protein
VQRDADGSIELGIVTTSTGRVPVATPANVAVSVTDAKFSTSHSIPRTGLWAYVSYPSVVLYAVREYAVGLRALTTSG